MLREMSQPTHVWPAPSITAPLRPLPHPTSSSSDGRDAGRFSSSIARAEMTLWISIIREDWAYLRASDSL